MALESLSNRPPLTSKLAAESVKLYLPDPSQTIRLQELVQNEAIRVRDLLSEYNVSVAGVHGGADELLRRVDFYEVTVDTLLQILIVGALYGSQEHRALWRKAFEVIGSSLTRVVPSIAVRSLTLQLYPLTYLFFGFGIASLLGEREYNFLEILRRWKFELNVGYPTTPHTLNNMTFCDSDGTGLAEQWPKAPNGQKYHMPFSEFLFGRLQKPLEGVASSPQKYAEAFDQFELMMDLDARFIKSSERVSGRYIYKIARPSGTQFINDLEEEVKQESGSRILQAGFFGGSLSKFEEQLKNLKDQIGQYRSYYW